MTKENKAKISFFILMATFGCMGPIVKAISLPSIAIVCLRAWISAIFLIVFVILTKRFPKEGISGYKPMIFSGVLIAGDWLGLFVAYNYTTVASATVCYYTAPIILTIGSALFLNEKLSIKHVICIILSFAGLALISGVREFEGAKGLLFSMIGATCYAAIILINKKYPEGDPIIRTTIQLFVAAVFTTPYVLATTDFSSVVISSKDVILLLILGVFLTGIAYIFYFSLITVLSSKSVAICSYADPLVSVIVSVAFMHEPITVFGITGTVLIIFSSLFSEIESR